MNQVNQVTVSVCDTPKDRLCDDDDQPLDFVAHSKRALETSYSHVRPTTLGNLDGAGGAIMPDPTDPLVYESEKEPTYPKKARRRKTLA